MTDVDDLAACREPHALIFDDARQPQRPECGTLLHTP